MKKSLILLAGAALLSSALSAQVVKSASPALAISNATNPCSGTDGAGGVTDTIAYTETGTISDVDVRTEIAHTWRGDLQFDLQYSGGGGVVVLAVDHDGSADDYFATFDDEAATTCFTTCGAAGACEAATPATCRPDGSLTVFDSLTSPGTWTMRVCDDSAGDQGVWNVWEMTVSGDGGLPVELLSFDIN